MIYIRANFRVRIGVRVSFRDIYSHAQFSHAQMQIFIVRHAEMSVNLPLPHLRLRVRVFRNRNDAFARDALASRSKKYELCSG